MAVEKKKIVFNPLSGAFDVSLDVSGMADTSDIVATYIPLSQKGVANGVVPLDAGNKISAAFLPNSVMQLQGYWDASTNTPTLVDGTGNPGDVWEVQVAGTVNFGSGGIVFKVGDWAVYAADEKWHPSINSNEVVSVNGLTGAVTLNTGNISESGNLYYTTARFDTQLATKSTDNLVEGVTNLYYTNARAKAATVADAIVDGVVDVAPSQNAVFDALALKADATSLASKANTGLDNLTTTSINQALLPDVDTIRGLGSVAKRWTTLHVQRIQNQASNVLAITNGSLIDFATEGPIAAWINNKFTMAVNKIFSFGLTTGEIQFSANSTSSAQAYVLPTAAPAVNGQVLASTIAGAMQWVDRPVGAVNLITNGDAENVTASIFTPYNDQSGARPTGANSASPTGITTAVISTNPLTALKSFTLTKDAANRRGGGWYIPFTVDLAYRAKSLKISVDYIVNSGTFAAGSPTADSDVIWYIQDVTNNVMIEPSNIKLLSNSTTLSDKYEATFQTSATGSSYRLIAHIATVSALAYELKVDNITLTPQNYVYGSPVTAFRDVINPPLPTGSGGGTMTVGTVGAIWSMAYRQVGEVTEVEYKFRRGTTGFVDITGAVILPLPPGVAAHSSLTNSDTMGYGEITATGSANPVARLIGKAFGGGIILDITDGSLLGAGGLHTVQTNYMTFKASFRTAGLTASTQMSDGYDGRVIAVSASISGTQSIATGTPIKIIWNTISNSFDKTAALNLTNGTVTVQTAGVYAISGMLNYAASGAIFEADARLYIDGSFVKLNNAGKPGTAALPLNVVFNFRQELRAGQTIEIYTQHGAGTALSLRANNSAQDLTNLNIEKLSGSPTISATDEISLSYTSTAGQVIPQTTYTALTYNARDYDSHGAFNPSTGVFTAPIAGRYRITVSHTLITPTINVGEVLITFTKNGNLFRRAIRLPIGNTGNVGPGAAATINLLAGETLSAQMFQANGGPRALETAFDANWITIERVK